MELFVVVIAILFVQVWGAENPFHQDQWLTDWVGYLEKRFDQNGAQLAWIALGSIFVITLFVLGIISLISYWLLLPVGVALLLYSFGRGEFSEIIEGYLQACKEDDWAIAIEKAAMLNVDVKSVDHENWSLLHQHVLEQAAYRGFERMFAVLFWFFLLGPFGAFLYRVTFLYRELRSKDDDGVKKILWYMEWPAVRVLGISFAFTGNFVGCYHRWRESVLCVKRPTELTLAQSVLGALSVDEELNQTCEVTRKELNLLDKLFRRTLWFWLAACAVIVIFV